MLVARGFFESRAKARAAIEAGGVTADGRPVAKPSELLADDAALVVTPAHPWVGRGALKLEHALAAWPIAVEGRVVLDVGASTGGFTEVCLAAGAQSGLRRGCRPPGQLPLRARTDDPGVMIAMEGVDARSPRRRRDRRSRRS